MDNDNQEAFDNLVAGLQKVIADLRDSYYGDPDSLDTDELKEDIEVIVNAFELEKW